VPVHMSAFSRHVSIMRLLPLGYEHYDARLAGLREHNGLCPDYPPYEGRHFPVSAASIPPTDGVL
jgi:hypothetical protein